MYRMLGGFQIVQGSKEGEMIVVEVRGRERWLLQLRSVSGKTQEYLKRLSIFALFLGERYD
jgi:hypothetical protein